VNDIPPQNKSDHFICTEIMALGNINVLYLPMKFTEMVENVIRSIYRVTDSWAS